MPKKILIGLSALTAAMMMSLAQAAVTDPIVFVSRQIPANGSIYMPSTNDMPGVGARSRFRKASPGKLLVRETNGTIRTLIDGSNPASNAFNLIDVNAPDVSYDGTQIAFAGLPNGSYNASATDLGAWRIFVINVDGTGLKQVTASDMHLDFSGTVLPFSSSYGYDDTDPCWLPDGRLVFTSSRWPSYGQYSGMRTTNLYVVNADGSNLHRITAERNGADRATIDPVTGKIAYARWWRNHRFPYNGMETNVDGSGNLLQKDGLSADRTNMVGGPDKMWRNAWHVATINPDGTGLAQWGGPSHGDGDSSHNYGGAFTDDGVFIGNFFPMPNMTEAAGFGGLRLLHRGGGSFQGLIGITSETLNYVATNPNSFGVFVPDANGYVSEPAVMSDGTLVVSRCSDYLQDYGLYTMNADGTGLNPASPLVDFAGTSELQAMAIRDRRPLHTPILTDQITETPSLLPPGPDGPYDQDGMFIFDAMNVFANDAVDKAVAAAPGIGTIANIRFFIDHQRSSPGSFPSKDWPIMLGELSVNKDGSVREPHAPANVPLFEQLRSPDGIVPILDGSVPHVAGMNYGRTGSVARCVGCHAGHTMIKLPATRAEAIWTNLAPGASVTVSSTMDAAQNRGLVDLKVNNGPIYAYWRSASGQFSGQWVKLTFPVDVFVRTVRLYNPRQGDAANSSIQVNHATVRLYSDAAGTQEIAANGADNVATGGTDVAFRDLKARVVKVEIDNVTGTFYGAKVASLAEVEVIAAGTPVPVLSEDLNGGDSSVGLAVSNFYSYPNPAVKKNSLTFHVEASAGADDLVINIYNEAWESIKQIHVTEPPAALGGKSVYDVPWDLSGVASGTYGYTVRVKRGSEVIQRFNKLAVIK